MYRQHAIRLVCIIHIAWASVLLVLTGWAGQGPVMWDEHTKEIPRFLFLYGLAVNFLTQKHLHFGIWQNFFFKNSVTFLQKATLRRKT